MSDTAVAERKLRNFETRQPFDLSNEMQDRLVELEMAETVAKIERDGYTIIQDAAPLAFTDRLRETCMRLAEETAAPLTGRTAALLLGRDPIYDEVVLNPKVQALAEIMCGKGFLLSQLICSIRPKGAPAIGLHADQNWFPAPFPRHNQLADDVLGDGRVHRSWRMYPCHPRLAPRTDATRTKRRPGTFTGAIPIGVPEGLHRRSGTVPMWHSNYPRTLEGERVVLHITFSRLSCRTVENYDHLDEGVAGGQILRNAHPAGPRGLSRLDDDRPGKRGLHESGAHLQLGEDLTRTRPPRLTASTNPAD